MPNGPAPPILRTRRRQEREETRRQILEVAERLLREHPFRELSVDTLMAATGHTRTVFYRHFSDLPDLVVQLLQSIGDELLATAQRWADDVGEHDEVSRESLASIVDFFARNGPVVRAVADAASYDHEIELIYQRFVNTFVEMTVAAFERRATAGLATPADVEETARALTWMNERYLLASFGGESKGNRRRALDALSTVWSAVLHHPGG